MEDSLMEDLQTEGYKDFLFIGVKKDGTLHTVRNIAQDGRIPFISGIADIASQEERLLEFCRSTFGIMAMVIACVTEMCPYCRESLPKEDGKLLICRCFARAEGSIRDILEELSSITIQ